MQKYAKGESKSKIQTVQSIERALQILKCFSVDRPEWGITEIAEELSLYKSTVHRIVSTLCSEGFLQQSDNGHYVLDWRLFELGQAVPSQWGGRKLVLEMLENLARVTGETAHLAVLDNWEVLYVEKVESSRALRMPSEIGKRDAAYCTALGKVLLACKNEAELLPFIYGSTLVRLTPNTIVNPDNLRSELQKVRQEGYAIDNEEYEIGLMCVAAPVYDQDKNVLGAVGIAGPAFRFQNQIDQQIEAVLQTAQVFSNRIGSGIKYLGDRIRRTYL